MAEQLAIRSPLQTKTETAAPGLEVVTFHTEDIVWRLQGILFNEKIRDPHYGQLPDDSDMWADDRLRRDDLLDYAVSIAQIDYPMPPPALNEFSLGTLIGFEEADRQSLLHHRVIKPAGTESDAGGEDYYLYENYGRRWFCQVVESL